MEVNNRLHEYEIPLSYGGHPFNFILDGSEPETFSCKAAANLIRSFQTNVWADMRRENKTSPNARERILEAAGEIFAECGYRKATVRDICGKAAVNLAAINYHFGDKENLYRETLRNAVSLSFQKYPPDWGVTSTDRPEARLRAYIRSFLFRVLDTGRSSRFGKILSREIIEPTSILDSLLKEVFYPNFLRLVSIIEEVVGREIDPETTRFCAASILGQCLYFGNSKTAAFVLFKKNGVGPEKIEEITDHITRFSLPALAALKKNPAPRRENHLEKK